MSEEKKTPCKCTSLFSASCALGDLDYGCSHDAAWECKCYCKCECHAVPDGRRFANWLQGREGYFPDLHDEYHRFVYDSYIVVRPNARPYVKQELRGGVGA